MQGTCRKEECKFWKKYKTGCPFFGKNPWYDGKTGEVKAVLDDCAHWRSIEMLKDLTMMLSETRVALQKASEQERNKSHCVLQQLTGLTKIATQKAKEIEHGRN